MKRGTQRKAALAAIVERVRTCRGLRVYGLSIAGHVVAVLILAFMGGRAIVQEDAVRVRLSLGTTAVAANQAPTPPRTVPTPPRQTESERTEPVETKPEPLPESEPVRRDNPPTDVRPAPVPEPSREPAAPKGRPAPTKEAEPREPPREAPEPETKRSTPSEANSVSTKEPGGGRSAVDLAAAADSLSDHVMIQGGETEQAGFSFPYPEYLYNLQSQVYRHFRPPPESSETVLVRFTLMREGTVQAVRVVRSSGKRLVDRAAIQAIEAAANRGRFGPLPPGYALPTLSVVFEFRPVGM